LWNKACRTIFKENQDFSLRWQKVCQSLFMTDKTQIDKLVADAKLAIETIEFSNSPSFIDASAKWLESIGAEIQKQISLI